MTSLGGGGTGAEGGNIRTYSVEEISQQVKATLDEAFGWIRVRGEVSSVSLPRSGHVYLTFKQERHELAAVMWKFKASRLSDPPREGIEFVQRAALQIADGHDPALLDMLVGIRVSMRPSAADADDD